MNKIYEKQTWHNDSAPALSEDNLNHIENGIDAIDSRLAGLTPADIGAVPNTCTVNNHALNEDISLTASDVGLGNVPNVTTNNQAPTFNEASTRANIASGESLSTLFGKIKKWFSDLKTVALTGSYNDLTDKPTIPPGVIVDQTYDPTSTDAQSGTAVAQAVGGITPGSIGISSANTLTSAGNNVYNFDSSKADGWYGLANINDDLHEVVILRILITDPDRNPDTQEDVLLNGFLICHMGDVENMGLSFYGVSCADPYFTAFRVINKPDEQPSARGAILQIKKEPNSGHVNSRRKITFSKYYGSLAVVINNTPVKYEPSDWDTEAYLSIPTVYSTNAVLNEIRVGNIKGNAVTSSATSGSDKLITSGGVYEALTDGSVTKIGTGNVGSATQPVYINGGVPTPIGAVDVIAEAPQIRSSSDLDAICALVVADHKTRFFRIAGTTGMDSTLSGLITYKNMVYPYGWGIISDSYSVGSSNYDLVITYFGGPGYPDNSQSRIFIWKQNSSGTFRQNNVLITNKDTDIQTGTPTNVNSNLTMGVAYVQKSGNVVHYRCKFTVATTFTPQETTQLCTMPYSASIGWDFGLRQVGDYSTTNTLGSCEINLNSMYFGSPPYTQLTQGTNIWISGEYFTND